MAEETYGSMPDLIAEAERLGREQSEIDKRNAKRRAKGRKPLPDASVKKDQEVLRRNYRTGDPTTVDYASALALYERRKSEMQNDSPDDLDGLDDTPEERHPDGSDLRLKAKTATTKASAPPASPAMPEVPDIRQDRETERAIREAEAARRVQDVKNGRIDHGGNWSTSGQRLEGGDGTSMFDIPTSSGTEVEAQAREPESAPALPTVAGLSQFRDDLYYRLKVSFDGLERSMSDLQGRVGEIVTATTPKDDIPEERGAATHPFDEFMSRRTPVLFNINGTKMAFDAVGVVHSAPCIVVVSRIDSASISPVPGSHLLLTYEMDGQRYVDDPVTFLGVRCDLPMFNMALVGFIRDIEAPEA